MAYLTLIEFYFKIWIKENRVYLPFFIINLLSILFIITNNEWGWIVVPTLFAIIIDIFFSDITEEKQRLLVVYGLTSVESHYAKLTAIFAVSVAITFNAYFILSFYEKIINLEAAILCISYTLFIVAFFHFVKLKLYSLIIIILGLIISSVIVYLISPFSIIHFILIAILLIIHFQYYLHELRGRF